MSDAIAGIDLRVPIGGLFVTIGALLAGFGIFTASNAEMYVKSGGININLWWGVAMLVTGALFLFAARRRAARPPT